MEVVAEVPAETPVEEVAAEPVVEPEPEPEPVVQKPSYTVGQTGPNGGLVFECEGRFLEIGKPVYGVSYFAEAMSCLSDTNKETGLMYRVPTIKELLAIYTQLVETWIAEDLELTYYWSCEEFDSLSVKVMNFDTGFEGVFYKEMDFLSVIPVVEL